jgi:hypothetical protein
MNIWAVICWASVCGGAVAACLETNTCQPAGEPPKLLLADTTRVPVVTVNWPTRDGKTVALSGARGYKSAGDKVLLGKNVEAYVALGGTRLERSAGDPDGAVVRCGLYKVDANQLFFENLAENAEITIEVRGVVMNQPALPRPKTGLMHLRYMLGDLKACGIDPTGRNLFVTADPDDPLKASVKEGSGKFGMLDGGPGHGSVAGVVEEDGTITMRFRFPYHALRHTKDPYQRTNPGGFFEPQHFHVEMELLPLGKAGEPEHRENGAG